VAADASRVRRRSGHRLGAGRNPERAHLAIANLTGAIRLLLGLGWPMIYFVFAVAGRRPASSSLPPIRLEPEHAVE